jgi:hypothetical protein
MRFAPPAAERIAPSARSFPSGTSSSTAPSTRSVKGTEGQWYKGVTQHFEGAVNWGGQTRDVTYTLDDSHDAAIDAAYAAKYGKGSATRAITSAAATETALRIDPM